MTPVWICAALAVPVLVAIAVIVVRDSREYRARTEVENERVIEGKVLLTTIDEPTTEIALYEPLPLAELIDRAEAAGRIAEIRTRAEQLRRRRTHTGPLHAAPPDDQTPQEAARLRAFKTPTQEFFALVAAELSDVREPAPVVEPRRIEWHDETAPLWETAVQPALWAEVGR